MTRWPAAPQRMADTPRMENALHVPVLLQEAILSLRPHSGGVYLDGTLGAGGYSEALLESTRPDGVVVAIDLDAEAVSVATQRLRNYGGRFIGLHGGFHQAATLLAGVGFHAVDGATLDLGLSSDQLASTERGFSFMTPGPLDMRFDVTAGRSLAEFLAEVTPLDLERVFREYGEERHARAAAERVCRARDAGILVTTTDLASAIAAGKTGGKSRIHPATRAFQALRIAVNQEMERLDAALCDVPTLLKPGARFCVVSYHSLEDRRVKLAFREASSRKTGWRVLTKHPIRPSREEVLQNRRSRSARLRVLEAPELRNDDRVTTGTD